MLSPFNYKILQSFIFFTIIYIIITVPSSCNRAENSNPANINYKLNQLGENKDKFTDLIKYFEKDKDSLKLKSLYFIIMNISDAKTINYTDGRSSSMYDIDSISIALLKKNIEDAVNTSRKDIQTHKISFTQFCEFVLPYRIENENLEDWRQKIKEKYSFEIDYVEKHALSHIDICKFFNKKIGLGFKYTNTSMPGSLKNWSQLDTEKRGNCAHMTKTMTYVLRTLGIPTTVDFTSSFGNVNGSGHMWNVIINSDQKSIPFMGLESNPGDYNPTIFIDNKQVSKRTFRRPAKVFREKYSINNKDFPENDAISQNRLLDVTDSYLQVSDVLITVKNKIYVRAYLSVYNNGNWMPIFWSIENQGNKLTFKKMARDMLYLPLIFQYGGLTQIDYPFILHNDGSTELLSIDKKKLINIEVKTLKSVESEQLAAINKYNWQGKAFNKALDNIALNKREKPIVGKQYTLYAWNNNWEIISKKLMENNKLIFTNVPYGSIYKITTGETNDVERPFTYQNGKQIWW